MNEFGTTTVLCKTSKHMYVEMHFGLNYLGQLRFHEIFLVRDYPFQTWVIFSWGEVKKWGNLPTGGGRGQKS